MQNFNNGRNIRLEIKKVGRIYTNRKFEYCYFHTKTLKNLKTPPQGARGGLQIFLGVNISFFCENKTPVKFQNSN